MSVLIGLGVNANARLSVFYEHLHALEHPAGSEVKQFRDPSLARSRNMLCEYAIARGHEYLFFLDDDHAFAPSTLMKLLAHDVDIVSGLYIMRHWPFHTVLFTHADADGKLFPLGLAPGMTGLIKVMGCGAGALLVKVSALKAMMGGVEATKGNPRCWFTIGDPIPDLVNEDFAMCKLAREKGFQIYADLDCILGHFLDIPIWPWRNEQDQWCTAMTSGAKRLYFPSALGLLQIDKVEQQAKAAAKAAIVLTDKELTL